jgi:hypothetical protein
MRHIATRHVSFEGLLHLQNATSVIPMLVASGCPSLEPDQQGWTATEHALLLEAAQCVYALYCAGVLFTKQQLLMTAILLKDSMPECAFTLHVLNLYPWKDCSMIATPEDTPCSRCQRWPF